VSEPELTESGGRLPQPTEEVHLPDPTYLPATLALGVALTLVGIVLTWVIAAIGIVIAVAALYLWLRLARRDMAELPLEH
jgi:hypothetical protein